MRRHYVIYNFYDLFVSVILYLEVSCMCLVEQREKVEALSMCVIQREGGEDSQNSLGDQ